MKFLVVINESEHGFDVHCPTLKGCHSQGNSFDEAMANIKDAIEQYLTALKELHRDKKVYEIEVAI